MAFQTIESLEKWFMDNSDEGPGSWRIWTGSPKQNYDSGMGKGESREQTWNLLKSHIENMVFDPGEYLTVRLYKNPNGQGGGSDITFRPVPKQAAFGGGSPGIGGIGGINAQSYIAEQIDQRMTIYDLRHQVEELRQELDQKQGFLERVVATVTEHPNFDPNALINGIGSIIANLIPKRAQVGVTGFSNQATGTDAAADPGTEEESARIAAALERLAANFPEIPLSKLLEDLANFVDQNPGMAKTFLQNLSK